MEPRQQKLERYAKDVLLLLEILRLWSYIYRFYLKHNDSKRRYTIRTAQISRIKFTVDPKYTCF